MLHPSFKPLPRALLLLTLILTCALQSRAGTDFTYNGITYTTITDSTCKTKIGSSSSAGNSVSGDLVIPGTVYDSDDNAYAVTSLSDYSFYGCTGLTSVSIPNTVTRIGNGAFEGCTGLTTVSIPKSITSISSYAFYGCTALNKVNINDLAAWCGISFGDLNSNPLYYAHHLYLNDHEITDLVIPDSVTSIRSCAFSGCTGLNSVVIHNSVISIGSDAFSDCTGLPSVAIPNLVTSIGDRAFSGCSSLQKFIVESDNTEFAIDEEGALYNKDLSTLLICPGGKTKFDIPNTVTKLGNYSLYNCAGLTSVTIPNSVTSIGDYAFYGCTGLPSVTIPNSVTSIALSSFSGCSGLVKSIYPNSIKTNPFPSGITRTYPADDALFEDGVVWKSDKSVIYFVPIDYEGEFTIPNTVTAISYYAFYGCTGITTVTIPNSVTGIGEKAFYGCTGLTSVSIPSSVTRIESQTFYGCSGLTSLVIPNSVTVIGDYAFRECTGLTSVSFPGTLQNTEAKRVGQLAFYGCTALQAVYIEDLDVWGDISFNFSLHGANPLYYAHHLYLNGEEVTEVSINPDHFGEIMPGTFDGCAGLTSVTIPNSVAYIDTYAFSGCTGLKSLTIPSSTQIIEAKAFEGCTGLTSIIFEDGEDELKIASYSYAFSGVTPTEVYFGRQMNFTEVPCTKLETVEFGKNVKSIADGAFSAATSLRSVTARSAEPPTISESTFADDTYNEGVLYVAKDAIDAYKTATGWEKFYSILDVDGTSGIAELGHDAPANVSVDGGDICVGTDADVRIVAMNGTTIYSGRGAARISVTPGIYIVITGDTATKVAVK